MLKYLIHACSVQLFLYPINLIQKIEISSISHRKLLAFAS